MAREGKLDRNVVVTGITSLLTDVSSEMIYPLLQAFVAAVMASRKAMVGPVLGLIEGVAESTASLVKLFAGYYSDRIQKRKGTVIAGYTLSSAAKALLLVASAGWYVVLLARFVEKIGKGIRTAPRDALISESMSQGTQGKAFGFQRAMDFAGATLGTVILYFVTLRFMDPESRSLRSLNDFYLVFALSLIPAFLSVVVLFFVRETGKASSGSTKSRPRPNLDLRKYDRNLRVFFLAQLLFTFGNSSNQFLLLRSMDLGHGLPVVILMYLVFNLTPSLLALPFGVLSDRIGRRGLLIAGYSLYCVVYASFGFLPHGANLLLWALWILYGFYYALTDGVEKAFVARTAPAESKATALGFYHLIVGVGLLPASLVAGLLFRLSPSAPFVFGASMSAVAVIVLGLGVREVAPKGTAQQPTR